MTDTMVVQLHPQYTLTEALKDLIRLQELLNENEAMQEKVRENLRKIQALKDKHNQPTLFV